MIFSWFSNKNTKIKRKLKRVKKGVKKGSKMGSQKSSKIVENHFFATYGRVCPNRFFRHFYREKCPKRRVFCDFRPFFGPLRPVPPTYREKSGSKKDLGKKVLDVYARSKTDRFWRQIWNRVGPGPPKSLKNGSKNTLQKRALKMTKKLS